MFFAHPNSHHQLFCWIWSRFSSRDCSKHKLNMIHQWPVEGQIPPTTRPKIPIQNQGSWKESRCMICIFLILQRILWGELCFSMFFRQSVFTPSEGFLNQLRLPPKWLPTFNGDGFRGALLPAKEGVDEFKLQLPPSCDAATRLASSGWKRVQNANSYVLKSTPPKKSTFCNEKSGDIHYLPTWNLTWETPPVTVLKISN